MGLFSNRRAISPLVATVLLISFSVALGAVVMSWGESYVEQKAEFVRGVQEVKSGCDAVTFSIITIKGIPQLCYTPTAVELSLDNGASIGLEDLHARLVDDRNQFFVKESTLSAPVKAGDPVKLSIPYIGLTKPVQVKFTPKIKMDGEVVFCAANSRQFENFRQC